jgi:hypothetical protein
MITLYSCLIFFHILLFVFWLGADLGVAMAGAQFRKHQTYSVPERLAILKLLVMIDMGPRSAWALMVASTISLLAAGGYWAVPIWGLALAWAVSLGWLWLVWRIHHLQQDPKAAPLKTIESALKWALAAFYLGLGLYSLAMDAPLVENWLAAKAVVFGLIFVAAILIDVMFKPVGPLLMKLIEEGSSEATEAPLLATMNQSRFWVRVTYALLVVIAFIGTTKAF